MRQLRLTDLELTDEQYGAAYEWLEELQGKETIIYYNKENKIVETDLRSVCNDIDIESVMTLGSLFFSYVQSKLIESSNWMKRLREDTLLHYSNVSESKSWSDSLCGIETFLKCVGMIVFPAKAKEIKKALLYQLTDPGCYDFCHLPEVNGRTSIIDFTINDITSLSATLRNYRNKSIHSPEFEEDAKRGPSVNDKEWQKAKHIAPALVQSTACLILLTLHYHYDTLYEMVVPQDVKEGNKRPDPWKLINETYLQELEQRQSNIVSDIYNFEGSSTEEEYRQRIIDVNVKRIELGEDGDSKSSDDADETVVEQVNPVRFIGDPLKQLLLFVGDAGTGKSIMVTRLVKHCVNEWREASADNKHLLPIRINLRNFNVQTMPNLKAEVGRAVTGFYVNNVEKQNVVDECVVDLLQKGNAIVFFDGLDEMKESNEFLDQLPSLIRDYPCQYVITSRHQGMEERLEHLKGFEVYAMCPLSDFLIREQLRYTLDVNNHASHIDIESSIESSNALHQMATNPFQLMLIVKMLIERGSSVGSLNLRNRGGLFFEFVATMTSRERSKNKDFDPEGMVRVLSFIAEMMDMPGYSAGLKWIDLRNGFERQTDIFGGRSGQLKEYVEHAISIGMMDKDDQGYFFTHKSWQEYFHAMRYVINLRETNNQLEIIEKIVKMMKDSQEDNKQRETAIQTLQLIFEVLERLRDQCSSREAEGIDQITCSIMISLLRAFQHEKSLGIAILPGADDVCKIEGRLGSPNEALVILAAATSTLNPDSRVCFDKDDDRRFFRPQPYKLVEMLLMNMIVLYKRSYPDGYINKDYLEPVFKAVALSGSVRPTTELFQPYWLKMWLLHIDDTTNILGNNYCDIVVKDDKIEPSEKVKEAKKKLRILSLTFVSQHSQPSYLLNRLIELHDILRFKKMEKSVQQVGSLMARLLSHMDERLLRSVYNKLTEGEPTYAKKMVANEALLFMSDPKYMMENYDFDFRYTIHKFCVSRLLQKASEEGMPDFLLRLCQAQNFPNKSNILRFIIQCNLAPEKMMQLISDPDSKLLPHESRIANLLPADHVPQWYVEKYFDKDVFQYVLENDKRVHNVRSEMERYRKLRKRATWRPVIIDQKPKDGTAVHRTRTDAVVLCTPSLSQVVLATEHITTPLMGLYARIDSFEQWFVVENSVPAEGVYIEMLLMGGSLPLSRNGHVVFTDEQSPEGADYDFAISWGNLHMIRICKAKMCSLLATAVVPVGQRVIADRHSMTLLDFDVRAYTPDTTIIRLKAVNEQEGDTGAVPVRGDIPFNGMVGLYGSKHPGKSSHPIKIDSRSRSLMNSVSDLTFIGDTDDGACFVSSQSPMDSLWVELSRWEYCQLKVVRPIKALWHIEFDLQGHHIPAGGKLRFTPDSEMQYHYCMWGTSPYFTDGVILYVIVVEGQDDSIISEADSLYVNGECCSLGRCRHKGKAKNKEFANLLLFDRRPSDVKVRQKLTNRRLYYQQDVANLDDPKTYEKRERILYATDHVKYSLDNSSATIIVPKPQEDLKGLYFRVNGQDEFFPVSQYIQHDNGTIGIVVDSKIPISSEGSLEFYKDKDGLQHVSMHFDSLMSLVHLSDSSRYHSSLCDILIDECYEKHQLGSASLFKFFQDLGNSLSYLNFYDTLDEEERQHHGPIYPHICCIVSKTPISVKFFSPQAAGLISTVKTRIKDRTASYVKGVIERYYQGQGLEQGMLVVYESSGLLSPVRLSQRLPEYGFVNGMIVGYNDQKNFHVRTELIEKDFFFGLEGSNLRRGDVVNFFPSVNASIKYKDNPMASNLVWQWKGVRKGTICKIERSESQCTIRIFSNSKKWPTADIEADVSEKAYYDNKDYFDSLRTGDEISYFLSLPYLKKKNNSAFLIVGSNE